MAVPMMDKNSGSNTCSLFLMPSSPAQSKMWFATDSPAMPASISSNNALAIWCPGNIILAPYQALQPEIINDSCAPIVYTLQEKMCPLNHIERPIIGVGQSSHHASNTTPWRHSLLEIFIFISLHVSFAFALNPNAIHGFRAIMTVAQKSGIERVFREWKTITVDWVRHIHDLLHELRKEYVGTLILGGQDTYGRVVKPMMMTREELCGGNLRGEISLERDIGTSEENFISPISLDGHSSIMQSEALGRVAKSQLETGDIHTDGQGSSHGTQSTSIIFEEGKEAPNDDGDLIPPLSPDYLEKAKDDTTGPALDYENRSLIFSPAITDDGVSMQSRVDIEQVALSEPTKGQKDNAVIKISNVTQHSEKGSMALPGSAVLNLDNAEQVECRDRVGDSQFSVVDVPTLSLLEVVDLVPLVIDQNRIGHDSSTTCQPCPQGDNPEVNTSGTVEGSLCSPTPNSNEFIPQSPAVEAIKVIKPTFDIEDLVSLVSSWHLDSPVNDHQ